MINRRIWRHMSQQVVFTVILALVMALSICSLGLIFKLGDYVSTLSETSEALFVLMLFAIFAHGYAIFVFKTVFYDVIETYFCPRFVEIVGVIFILFGLGTFVGYLWVSISFLFAQFDIMRLIPCLLALLLFISFLYCLGKDVD
ncbi:MAG: hypothetical protein IJ864_02515 [Alphaproteobacteria bacterium]|nr:hypothetical protein [Alphaproteobacteria bacterium]